MMDNIGVYQIELNGKKYIGSSSRDFNERWNNHLRALKQGKHENRYLQNAYNKYGEKNIKFSILEIVETPEECIILEQKYIDEIKPEYNICPLARSPLGTKRTLESKQKMSDSKKGNKYALGHKQTEEHKQNNKKARLGHKVSEETKKKMRYKMIGNNRSLGNKNALGCIRSDEEKQKIRNKLLGHKTSDTAKQKISEASKRMWLMATAETKKKMSVGHCKKEESKNKIRKANLGRIFSEETRQKMSKSAKIRCQRARDETTI